MPNDFDGSPDDLEELMGQWDEWFEPAEGILAFQALVGVVKKKQKAVKKLENPEAVVTELEELVRVLQIAEKQSIKFRLEMG